MSSYQVAVYGSLRKGFHNHGFLERSKYLGTYSTTATYTMIDLGSFPGILGGGVTSILVELYEVTPNTLKDLDILEGVPHFYERWKVRIPSFGYAHIYVLSDSYLYDLSVNSVDTIDSGDWCY